MSEDLTTVGKIKEYEAFQIEWKIHDFFLKKNKFRNDIDYNSPVFSFLESTWMLKLWQPVEYDWTNCLFLYITKFDSDNEQYANKNIQCKLGLKKTDGSVEYFPNSSDLHTIYEFSDEVVISKQELLLRRKDLVNSNVMTVICTLRYELTGPVQKSASPVEIIQNPSSSLGLCKLSEDFKQFYANKDSCDVTLRVKEKEFQAHKTVLMARSSVFAFMFHHETLESKTGIITISDCDPDSFHVFLEYLYYGRLENLSFSDAFYLYSTSDKYDTQELKSCCVNYMEQNMSLDNVCDVLKLADLHDDTKLFSAAQNFFGKNASNVMDTTHWESLLKNNYRLANRLIKEVLANAKIGDS